MGLKAIGADRAFINGLFNGNRWLAAFSAAMTEQAWGDYARIATALANYQASGRNYVNSGVLNFADPTSAGVAITHWGMYDAANAGNLLLDYELASALAAPQVGASVGFDAGAIGWGFSGAVTEMGSRACCSAGLLSGTRYLSIHTDDPGTAGDNAVANEDPIQVMQAQWTLDTTGANRRARNNAVLSFGASTADLPVAMWVALRDGDADDANVLWKDQFDTTPDDPDLGDTLQFNVNQLAILIGIDV